MKHLVLGDTAFSWRQPSIEVASTVPFALPFFCQMDRATLQSKLTRPHGFSAGITKYPAALGWHRVDRVRFQVGVQVGGGQLFFCAQDVVVVGEGSTRPGAVVG